MFSFRYCKSGSLTRFCSLGNQRAMISSHLALAEDIQSLVDAKHAATQRITLLRTYFRLMSTSWAKQNLQLNTQDALLACCKWSGTKLRLTSFNHHTRPRSMLEISFVFGSTNCTATCLGKRYPGTITSATTRPRNMSGTCCWASLRLTKERISFLFQRYVKRRLWWKSTNWRAFQWRTHAWHLTGNIAFVEA